MKKFFAVVLSLAMVLSLSVTAFAAPTGSISNDDGTSTSTGTGAEVNATYVKNPKIAASITWGDMNFTYFSESTTWAVSKTDGNKVVVKNDSPEQNIKATYTYSVTEIPAEDENSPSGVYDDMGFSVFTAQVSGYIVEGTNSVSAVRALYNGNDKSPYTGSTLTTDSYDDADQESIWLMFTDYTSDSSLNATKVGTLTISIAADNS